MTKIVSPTDWSLVKTFPCGLEARSSKVSGAVALFTALDDGDLFMVSEHLTKHPAKTPVEIADSLYS